MRLASLAMLPISALAVGLFRGADPGSQGARLTGLVRFLGDSPRAPLVEFGACPNCAAENEEVAFRIEDNVHSRTSGWIGVPSSPYFAVTGEEGSFDLPDLPPGEVELAVWHETLGEQSQTLSLAAGETKRVEFGFRRGPSR
ncbi:MAG: carboxypeptidase-like regulatory domain-containing protein [Planctomycetota bacterium]